MMGGGGPGRVNAGSIYVKLQPMEARTASQEDLMVRARELLSRYPGELRTAVQESGGPGGGGGMSA